MNTKITSVLLLVFALISSCQKEDDLFVDEEIIKETNSNNPEPNDDPFQSGDMVIGKKLENPYSIENINKAIEIINSRQIQGSRSGKSSAALATLDATHYYIKFNPTSKAHCEILLDIEDDDNEDLLLFAYPLDSEIIQEGTTPLDEGVTDAGINVLYGVMPIGDAIPNVPYEILDRIIPDLNEDFPLVEAISFVLTNNGDEIKENLTIDEVFEHQDELINLDKSEETETIDLTDISNPTTNLFLPSWTPQGNLLVYDTNKREGVGVRRTQVSIGRWFKWTRVYTNDNGTYLYQIKSLILLK